MAVATKAKEMSSSAVGRFGASGVGTDVIRVFNRALELVNSNSVESENELLDLVKKAKREMEKEPVHLPKKVRSGRIPSETPELQSLGHRTPMVPVPMDITSNPPAVPWTDGTAPAAGAAAAGLGSMTHAQARLMNVIRGGPGRGRIEKPRRKLTR